MIQAAEVEACEETSLSSGGEGTRVRLAFAPAGRRATDLASATFVVNPETAFFERLVARYPEGGTVTASEFHFLEVDFERETDRLGQPAAREVLGEEGDLLPPYEGFSLRDLRGGGVQTGAADFQTRVGALAPIEDLTILRFPQRPGLNVADGAIALPDGMRKAEPDKFALSEDLRGRIERFLGGQISQDSLLVRGDQKRVVYQLSESVSVARHLTPTLPVLLGCSSSPRRLPRSAVLELRLAAGDPYELGADPFEVEVEVAVEMRVRTVGASPAPPPETRRHVRTLRVTQQAPEQVVLLNYADLVVPPEGPTTTVKYVDRITVRPVAYARPGRDDAHEAMFLEASLEEEVGLDVRPPRAPERPIVQALPLNSPSEQNPVLLKWKTTWETACPTPPAYQVQVLRLFNVSPDRAYDEMRVRAPVDWKRALTVEVEGSEEVELTLAEGTGYYVWRVRPIGSFYAGGVADARNWGAWSEAPVQGQLVDLTSPSAVPPYAFFYQQFDDDKNWIFRRAFAEEARTGESVTYANGLLQVVQAQARLASEGDVLASQTVQDFAGRSALRSLAAPLGRPHLAYEPGLLTSQGGGFYTAEAFDRLQAQNFRVPEPAAGGVVADYYSDRNPDQRIPSAEGYPFTRTRYLGDGTGREVEASSVGRTHRLGGERTVKTYYTAAADEELVRIFGDEAPKADAAEKVIVFDPNGTATVRYADRDGQTLATALALTGPTHPLLADLPSRASASFPVTFEEGPGRQLSRTATESVTPFGVSEPGTQVMVSYELNPERVDLPCAAGAGPMSAPCAYDVELTIRSTEDPSSALEQETFRVEGENARQVQLEITLGPGTYEVAKRVRSVAGSQAAVTVQAQALRQRLQEAASQALPSVSIMVRQTAPVI